MSLPGIQPAETARDQMKREPCWTESLAVGSAGFVEKIKPLILSRRDTVIAEQSEDRWVLEESITAYGQKTGSKKLLKGGVALGFLAPRQHAVHPFVRLLVGFETVNTFRSPAVLERTVQLNCERLQLHGVLESVRSLGAPSDDFGDPFFDIDERWYHSNRRITSAHA